MVYTSHKDGIPRSQIYRKFAHACYTVKKCINVKISGLKAVSFVLYSPPASLCLDCRLQIRKDS